VLHYESDLKEFTKDRPVENDFLFIGLDNKNRWKPLACKYVNFIFNKYSAHLIEEWKIQRKLHPHMERHAFATNCVYAWLSQQATTRLMRHRDPKTTENYYHMNDTRLKSQFDMIK
jgi:site-specific recombinase XerD